jgi:hypothetical protein
VFLTSGFFVSVTVCPHCCGAVIAMRLSGFCGRIGSQWKSQKYIPYNFATLKRMIFFGLVEIQRGYSCNFAVLKRLDLLGSSEIRRLYSYRFLILKRISFLGLVEILRMYPYNFAILK